MSSSDTSFHAEGGGILRSFVTSMQKVWDQLWGEDGIFRRGVQRFKGSNDVVIQASPEESQGQDQQSFWQFFKDMSVFELARWALIWLMLGLTAVLLAGCFYAICQSIITYFVLQILLIPVLLILELPMGGLLLGGVGILIVLTAGEALGLDDLWRSMKSFLGFSDNASNDAFATTSIQPTLQTNGIESEHPNKVLLPQYEHSSKRPQGNGVSPEPTQAAARRNAFL